MDDEYVIRDTPQLKAVSNPLRIRMLEQLMVGPRTATQLGAALSLAPSRAHYHLKQLEAAGLCRLVEQRAHAGVLEKYYRAVAGRFRIERLVTVPLAEPVAGDGPAPRAAAGPPAGYLERLQEFAARAPGREELMLQELTLRLSTARYQRLVARLHALLLEFDSDRPAAGPAGRTYRLLVTAYPESAPEPGPPAP